MKNFKRTLILFSIASVLLIGVGCSKEVKTKLTSSEHIMESITHTLSGDMDVSVLMDFNLDYEALKQNEEFNEFPEAASTILNELSLEYDYKMKSDLDNKKFDFVMDYGINYKSNPLLALSMIANNDEMGMGITNFYDKYFVINFKSVMDQIVKESDITELKDIDLEKYVMIIFNTDSELYNKVQENEIYKTLIMKHLEGRLQPGVNEEITYNKNGEVVTEQVLTYVYDFDMKSYMNLLVELILEIKNDDNAKAYAKEVVNALVTELLESEDYKKLDATEEDILGAKEVFDANFDEGWNELFDEMLEEYKSLNSTFDSVIADQGELQAVYDSIDFKISVNKDSLIRKVETIFDYNGFGMNMSYTINGIGDDVVIESKDNKYINIMDFIDFENDNELKNKDELAVIVKELLMSGINELTEGEAFTALYNDLLPLEEDLGMTVADIKMSLGMAKVSVENMSLEDITSMLESSMGSNDYDYDYDYDYDVDSVDVELVPLESIAIVIDESNKPYNYQEILDAAMLKSAGSQLPSVTYESSKEKVQTDLQKAIDEGANLIFISGEDFGEDVAEMATLYKNVRFVVLSGDPDYYDLNLSITDYYNEESAYIAGTVAALSSETGVIGFVGGFEDMYTQNYAVSFKNGAIAANPEIDVQIRYAQTTDDYDIGKSIGNELAQNKVDVIYHYADKVGEGLIDNSVTAGYKFIGNESSYGSDLPTYLTATLRDYTFIFDAAIENYSMGYLDTYLSYGVYGNVLYLPDGNMSDIVKEQRDILVEQIESGEIYIPTYDGE